MRPITVSVGPIVAGNATALAGSQQPTVAGSQYLLANTPPSGSASNAVVGNVTITNGVLTVNSTASGVFSAGIALMGTGLKANTRIVGPGPVAGTWIVSPTQSFAAGTVRGNQVATLDAPRQILITNTEAAGNSFTVYGTDAAGNPISETLATTGGNLTTSQSFATVSQVTVANPPAAGASIGTAGTATSPWVMFDPYVSGGNISKQTVVQGAVNYTVQVSYDDPNAPGGPAPGAMGWLNDTDATFVGATTSLTGVWTFVPLWARVLLNSGAGSLRATFIQPGNLGR